MWIRKTFLNITCFVWKLIKKSLTLWGGGGGGGGGGIWVAAFKLVNTKSLATPRIKV